MSNHQKYDLQPIGDFVLHPRNPRRGDIGAIAESIERNGWYGAVITQKSTGYVIAGNHRVMAARQLGFTSLPTFELDVDDATALRIMLADNRSSDRASNDEGILAQLLQEIATTQGDLAGTLYDSDDLDQLLRDVAGPVPADADDVPDPPADPVTKPGEVIELGAHRLVCGDAQDPAVIDLALAGATIDCVFTDPPYGVEYQGGTKKQPPIAGDEHGSGIYGAVLPLLVERARSDAAYYIWYADRSIAAAAAAAIAPGLVVRCQILWLKNHAQFGSFANYHSKHEPCLYASRPEKAPPWFGPANEVTVWEYDRAPVNEFHPTQKPVALAQRAIENSTRHGELVIDPFGGSGSTLIACEHTGRRCAMVEIDPAYCDVIRARYAQFVAASHPTPA